MKTRKRKIKTFYATICGQDEFVYATNKFDAYKILFERVKGLTKKDLSHPRNRDLREII